MESIFYKLRFETILKLIFVWKESLSLLYIIEQNVNRRRNLSQYCPYKYLIIIAAAAAVAVAGVPGGRVAAAVARVAVLVLGVLEGFGAVEAASSVRLHVRRVRLGRVNRRSRRG